MRQTPFDTGERYEAKPWYPDRSDPDTYGKVDFEDDAGQTALTMYVAREDGKPVIHVYDHGIGDYAIVTDDRDHRFEVPEPVDATTLSDDELVPYFRQLERQEAAALQHGYDLGNKRGDVAALCRERGIKL